MEADDWYSALTIVRVTKQFFFNINKDILGGGDSNTISVQIEDIFAMADMDGDGEIELTEFTGTVLPNGTTANAAH